MRCQCEHECHFTLTFLSPNGNPGHKGQVNFDQAAMREVATPYGKFTVCADCATDCMSPVAGTEDGDDDWEFMRACDD